MVFEPNKTSFPSSKFKSELQTSHSNDSRLDATKQSNYAEELLSTQNASVQSSAFLLQEEGGEKLSKEKGSSFV